MVDLMRQFLSRPGAEASGTEPAPEAVAPIAQADEPQPAFEEPSSTDVAVDDTDSSEEISVQAEIPDEVEEASPPPPPTRRPDAGHGRPGACR